ncbi:MAG: hypothetical protein ACKESB_01710 [Candidatus Hodgkinia cicadicola]
MLSCGNSIIRIYLLWKQTGKPKQANLDSKSDVYSVEWERGKRGPQPLEGRECCVKQRWC